MLHPKGCGCAKCVGERLHFSYSDKFVREETEKVSSLRTLHHIGKVRLTLEIHRKQKNYAIFVDEILVGHSRDWPDDAFRMAREMFQKPKKKIVGEILAYRGWGLVGDLLIPIGGIWRSNEMGECWSKGPVAVSHEKPTPENSSGLYAVRLDHTHIVFGYYPAVHGIVGLFGRVVELERGYRAEKAIVRVLRVVPPVGDIVLRALEERYQCQVFRQKRS